jgi:hypothetical protein
MASLRIIKRSYPSITKNGGARAASVVVTCIPNIPTSTLADELIESSLSEVQHETLLHPKEPFQRTLFFDCEIGH